MTTAPIDFGDLRIYGDPAIPPDTLALGLPDGTRFCVACGCRADAHCKYGHECLTGQGTSDECPCAKLTLEVPMCSLCGHLFQHRWQQQVHALPVPTCTTSAWAAAGKYAEPEKFVPPLKRQRQRVGR